MNYYDQLNNILSQELSSPHFTRLLPLLNEVVKLATIIIQNTPSLTTKQCSNKVPLNDSLQNVESFFYQLNPIYASRFQYFLHEQNTYKGQKDNTVKFYRILKDGQSQEYEGQSHIDKSQVNQDGSIHIDYNETIEDTFTIAHEHIHRFSYQPQCNSDIKQFLGETPTITIEYLLQDYLLNNSNYNHDEINIRLNNRLNTAYDDAIAIITEYLLLNLYQQNNHHLTPSIIIDYLNSLDKTSKLYQLLSTRGLGYLNDIVNKRHLQFPTRQRYVIGTILASDLYNQIQSAPLNITKLFRLIDILGHNNTTIDNDIITLKQLDIPIFHQNKIELIPVNISRLTKSYQQIIAKLNHQTPHKTHH